jgi:hypothetical protein
MRLVLKMLLAVIANYARAHELRPAFLQLRQTSS